MEFEGRIQRVLPVRSGTSRSGNEYMALPFVFEYFEDANQRTSDKVLLETSDRSIMAKIGAYLKKGADKKAVIENGECVLMYELKCRVGFSHSVREYDKQDGTKATINNIRCYKFEIAGQQGQQGGRAAVIQQHTEQISPQAQPTIPPSFPPPYPQPTGGQADDDLPF